VKQAKSFADDSSSEMLTLNHQNVHDRVKKHDPLEFVKPSERFKLRAMRAH
jgi:hypothetical protein